MHYRHTSYTILFLFLLVACTQAPEPTPTPTPSPEPTNTPLPEPTATLQFQVGEVYTGRIEVNETSRLFHLYVPSTYQRGTLHPLIFNLHPFGTGATQQELISSLAARADELGYIVVNPQGLDNPPQWQVDYVRDNHDAALIRALIAEVDEKLELDHKRIYVTGFSNGGGMTHRAGCELSDVIAAIAPYAAVYPIPDTCETVRPLPVLAMHGLADDVLPYEGSVERALKSAPKWTEEWAVRNGCELETVVEERGRGVSAETYTNCPDNATVTLISLANWGHIWPNRELLPPGPNDPDFDAADAILEFFGQHQIP